MLLLIVADVVQDACEHRTGHVEEGGRVGAEDEFVDRPRHHLRCGHSADLFIQADPEPFTLLPGLQ